MADGLQGVLDALATAITTAAAPTTVSVAIGDDKLNEHAAPPRVVLWAMSERVTLGHTPARTRQQSNPAVAMWQRKVMIGIRCWGTATRAAPYEGTDGLVNTVLAALDREAKGNYQIDPVDGDWTPTDEAALGRMVTWRVEILMPITYPRHATATITDYDNDVRLVRADGTEESAGIFSS